MREIFAAMPQVLMYNILIIIQQQPFDFDINTNLNPHINTAE